MFTTDLIKIRIKPFHFCTAFETRASATSLSHLYCPLVVDTISLGGCEHMNESVLSYISITLIL
jgi:hypothetical protein